jgi:hypothetical protein
MEVGGRRHAPAAFTPGKDPVPIVQEAGWAPGPVWIGAENLTPHWDLIESLYRLSYRGRHPVFMMHQNYQSYVLIYIYIFVI